MFDEINFQEVRKFNTPEIYYSTHGHTEEQFLLTDNNGSVYVYRYDQLDPVECLENIGLYPIIGESHWVDETRSLHMHGSEGIKRHRISGDNYFCLFDWNKREIVWKSKPEAKFGFGHAVGGGKLVYQDHSSDGEGIVYCLDINTGKESWRKHPLEMLELSDEERDRYDRGITGGVLGNPRILGNLAIIGMHYHWMIALDIESGHKVWEYRLTSDKDNYEMPLHHITSSPYRMAVTEQGKVYRLETAMVTVGYDKYAHLLFLIELDALTGNLLNRLQVRAPEGDLQEHIIAPYEKDFDFGQETYCDVTETHYFTCFASGPIMVINLKTGIVDWHITLPTGSVRGQLLVLNNRLYTSSGRTHYIFEGEGGYIPD